ncbi:MAG TPA: UV DNA damage repair endonuclease UvsE [Flavisolibacter sp.]|nr:UV DNA damage repair endonuclease UvsE [Flavisolibacter sp.]
MNLGYACINMGLAKKGLMTNRGMIRKTFLERGVEYASGLALKNVEALFKILQWNLDQGIRVFRMSSDLFPWASEYRLRDLPDFKAIQSILVEAGKLPVRLSSHPGPFNKLAGDGRTLQNTIKELETHAEIFDLMELPPSHWNKINIHVGGAYGDKNDTIKRFAQNFKTVSASLKSRLTIENDDKPGLFTVHELYHLHELTGIPIVFDYFHHRLNPGKQTEEEAFAMAYSTWKVLPIFHYSSSKKETEDPAARREAHADWVHEPINTYGKEVDLILEAKMKEQALLKYRQEFQC